MSHAVQSAAVLPPCPAYNVPHCSTPLAHAALEAASICAHQRAKWLCTPNTAGHNNLTTAACPVAGLYRSVAVWSPWLRQDTCGGGCCGSNRRTTHISQGGYMGCRRSHHGCCLGLAHCSSVTWQDSCSSARLSAQYWVNLYSSSKLVACALLVCAR